MNILQTRWIMSEITINLSPSTLPVRFFTASARLPQPDVSRTKEEMSFYQILFVLEGVGMLYSCGKEIPLKKGSAFFLSEGTAYRHEGQNMVTAFLSLKGNGMKAVAERYTENGLFFIETQNPNTWVDRISDYISSYKGGATEERLSALAYTFYLDFFEEGNRKSVTPIDLAISFMENHFSEKISLEDIASFSGISVSGLCHKFKKAYGKTVIEHLLSLRLEWARGYLEANPSSLTKDVARLSGFDDTSYFCHAFKKKYKKSPRGN